MSWQVKRVLDFKLSFIALLFLSCYWRIVTHEDRLIPVYTPADKLGCFHQFERRSCRVYVKNDPVISSFQSTFSLVFDASWKYIILTTAIDWNHIKHRTHLHNECAEAFQYTEKKSWRLFSISLLLLLFICFSICVTIDWSHFLRPILVKYERIISIKYQLGAVLLFYSSKNHASSKTVVSHFFSAYMYVSKSVNDDKICFTFYILQFFMNN